MKNVNLVSKYEDLVSDAIDLIKLGLTQEDIAGFIEMFYDDSDGE
jgi:hypothetical protein